MQFERGILEDKDILRLFSKLLKTGTVWQLQGSYGRFAKKLIDQNLINEKGEINWAYIKLVEAKKN